MLNRVLAITIVSLLFSVAAETPRRAKNVILFLADAGGLPTLSAASLLGHNAPQKLFVQSWPNIALSDTSTAAQWVSDSAAGMTAIVTGQKTRNGIISQGADAVRGKQDGARLKTILEYAEEHGLSTGVMSNVTITDATPAACFSHVNDRRKWGDIFSELFQPRFGDGVDVLFGPGRAAIAKSLAEQGKDFEGFARSSGRPVYSSLAELPEDARRGLVVIDGEIDLPQAARRAVRMLSKNSKGFFLMIESDAHTNQPETGLRRLVAFDQLIRELSQMVNMKETLLVFTADHSFDFRVISGNLGDPLLKGYDEWKESNAGKKSDVVRLPYLQAGTHHTGEEVVVAAMGPGSEQVRGFIPNTRVFEVMLKAYGWKRDPDIRSGPPNTSH